MFTFNKITLFTLPVLVTLLPHPASAQLARVASSPMEVLIVRFLNFANETLIPAIIGIGFLFFVWGVFLYFIVGGADEEKRAKGRSYVIHATIGFVVIIIFSGIVNLITESIGLEGQILENVPGLPMPTR